MTATRTFSDGDFPKMKRGPELGLCAPSATPRPAAVVVLRKSRRSTSFFFESMASSRVLGQRAPRFARGSLFNSGYLFNTRIFIDLKDTTSLWSWRTMPPARRTGNQAGYFAYLLLAKAESKAGVP